MKRKTRIPETSTTDNDPLFFYMPDDLHGEFSQWYPATFTVSKEEISSLIDQPIEEMNFNLEVNVDTESITFTCAEQFMMYCKAGRFHDTSTQSLILSSPSPKEQKRLGKAVTGFSDTHWDTVKSDVVVAGNTAKFGQNEKLKRKLLATGERLLCEAASGDRVWGIGYSAKRAMAFREHWGENPLGAALMEVRGRLRREVGGRNAWQGDWPAEEGYVEGS
jgi:ribA/ribD-fused uncharacterized protein